MPQIAEHPFMLYPSRERRRFTAAEYLRLEEQAETRSEFCDGEIFAMSGATVTHNRLTRRLVGALERQLAGGTCEVFSTDLRLHVERFALYTYPDVLVSCGPLVLLPGRQDTLVDATLIAEVLSPSTEAYDRTEKFRFYQGLASFSDYLLISQELLLVEHRSRTAAGEWRRVAYSSADGVVELPAIGARLTLAELYAGVVL